MTTTRTGQYSSRTLTVLAEIERVDTPISAAQLVQATGLHRTHLSTTLTRLVRRGLILKLDHGMYQAIGGRTTPPLKHCATCTCGE